MVSEALLRVNHYHSAFILAAAASARRYTGPCAIHKSQTPVPYTLKRTYYERWGRRVMHSHQRPEAPLSF